MEKNPGIPGSAEGALPSLSFTQAGVRLKLLGLILTFASNTLRTARIKVGHTMTMDSSYLNVVLLLACYPTTVSALAFWLPRLTDTAAFLPASPPPSLPTLPPVLPDLLRRQ